jgi:hypothetical protein
MATQARSPTLNAGASAVEKLSQSTGVSQARMMGAVRAIGGAMIGIAILAVVLSEVFTLDAIANDTGPFSSTVDSLESTGGAALGLLVIGLLVVAANQVMGFFGGGGF